MFMAGQRRRGPTGREGCPLMVLRRGCGETILIGEGIRGRVLKRGSLVERIRMQGPREVVIVRERAEEERILVSALARRPVMRDGVSRTVGAGELEVRETVPGPRQTAVVYRHTAQE